MRSKALQVFAIVAGLSLSGCYDILERDISREQVQLLMPADNSVVNMSEVNFRWEEVKGGRSYRLQVASPSFSRPTQVYIDTVTSNTALSLPLRPGEYEWRVQALNAGYETAFAARTFMLDSASNLTGAVVRLLIPARDIHINSQSVQFSWEPVALADKYILELLDEPRFDTVVYVTSVKKTFPRSDRSYRWRVRALNATGVAVSPTRAFTTDFVAPSSPELLFPRTDTTVFTWPVQLKWRRVSDDVAGDSLFLFLSDQQSIVEGFPKRVANSTFSLTESMSLAPGDFFWAVKSFDRAGNVSGVTLKRKITVR